MNEKGPWIQIRYSCQNCKGTGKVPNTDPFPMTGTPAEIACRPCEGKGREKEPRDISLQELKELLAGNQT